MKCFVIMPFDPSFDDVYATIKAAVEAIEQDVPVRCFRIDEKRPAGRITDRLLTELREASVCVADLTGCKPNVMWEAGYVMALNKPLLVVTQGLSDMPFDLKDMQSIHYDRAHLTQSLGHPLKRLVEDTLAAVREAVVQSNETHQDSSRRTEIAEIQAELTELKDMIGQLVKAWNPNAKQAQQLRRAEATMNTNLLFSRLEGAWRDRESRTHLYARMVNCQLLAPYCYEGNDQLSGVYYGWSRMGEYWFARFTWVAHDISGFSFLKEETGDAIAGAWWLDEDISELPDSPPEFWGVPMRLERLQDAQVPMWAEDFFERARREDVVRLVTRQ